MTKSNSVEKSSVHFISQIKIQFLVVTGDINYSKLQLCDLSCFLSTYFTPGFVGIVTDTQNLQKFVGPYIMNDSLHTVYSLAFKCI